MSLWIALLVGILACKHGNEVDSKVKLHGGKIDDTGLYPAVVLLRIVHPDFSGSCTGTFVGEGVLVTARHCVGGMERFRNADRTEIDVEAAKAQGFKLQWLASVDAPEHAGIAKRIFINPQYHRQVPCSTAFDFAVVMFEPRIAPAKLPIFPRKPEMSDMNVVVVGFGANDNGRFGPRRYGDAKFQQVGIGSSPTLYTQEMGRVLDETTGGQRDRLDSDEPGVRPLLEVGDSGGPLLVDGAVAGVHSLSGGFHTALAAASNVNVLKRASLAGAAILGLDHIAPWMASPRGCNPDVPLPGP